MARASAAQPDDDDDDDDDDNDDDDDDGNDVDDDDDWARMNKGKFKQRRSSEFCSFHHFFQ